MPGVFWYLALAALGLGSAAYIICRNKNAAKLISFYLLAALLADSGEILVMVLLKSYSYKPGVSDIPMIENVIGHVIPNSTLWPATAVLVAVYALRLRWIALITAFYVLLDVLFIRLGIYEHHWWQTYMTGIAIFAYCYLMRWWYSKLENKRFRILRYLMLTGSLCMLLLTANVGELIFGKTLYHVGLFENAYRDSIVFLYLTSVIQAFIGSFFICLFQKWYLKLVPFVLFPAADLALHVTGVMSLSAGWNVVFAMAICALSVFLFLLLERKYSYRQ